jgi:hypothetical protein
VRALSMVDEKASWDGYGCGKGGRGGAS